MELVEEEKEEWEEDEETETGYWGPPILGMLMWVGKRRLEGEGEGEVEAVV